VKETIRERLSVRYAHLVEANLRTFDRGYRELQIKTWPPRLATPVAPCSGSRQRSDISTRRLARRHPGLGQQRAQEPERVTTGFLPAYDPDSCAHCRICDIVCPDLCFVWSDDSDGEGQFAAARDRLPLPQGLPEVHRRVLPPGSPSSARRRAGPRRIASRSSRGSSREGTLAMTVAPPMTRAGRAAGCRVPHR
jgi:NAD-dependent dihydropyrimidine dehydrogenase PreA subunit